MPIHCSDLTDIIYEVISNNIYSKIIECIGPEEFSFKEILEKLSELHFIVIDDLILNHKKKTHEEVKYLFDRLASIYEGIFLCDPCWRLPNRRWPQQA